ncbi:hypothetical protein CHOED_063 [Vibrio phage CHOED]|uniref:hypothetical protein n=1 Tax=Vibrio phage CHOED TaxID=1458716 RepID=UPI00042F2118|nr:hypothetical protein CHOED_063 [Vibrio phage CHOED]AHK11923.1 hypothetical protein CHOED_063 [Vibrio phage CHOED]
MNIFIIFIILFALAALGIVCYYKLTSKGRLQDVYGDLEESQLQGSLLDSIEATRRSQQELHARVEALRKQ